MNEFYKLPRVYTDQPIKAGQSAALSETIHHYLRNVMRMEQGDALRLFNGKDGEYTAALSVLDKKNAVVLPDKKIREQPQTKREVHLLFAPIRKERMDWLVEKSVELGVTHLHPVLTQNTDLRKINEERMQTQIIEAAEQCERLDIPVLSPLQDLFKLLAAWGEEPQIYAALERYDTSRLSEKLLKNDQKHIALLIGPSGGFTAEEMDRIVSKKFAIPVNLGDNILRSETAALAALSILAV